MGVSNRRLRIDFAAIKEVIEMGEVEKVEWIDSRKQVVDGFYKD